MEHLSLETLSRLVDESPTAEESAHLERCGRCAGELGALRAQTTALGALPDVRPPRGDWDGLEARLVAEGLVHARIRSLDERLVSATPWLRRAAAIALFLGGAGTGAAVMSRIGPTAEGAQTVAALQVGTTTDPGTALAQVQDAERVYIGALSHYRQLMSTREGGEVVLGDPEQRYAALEQVVQAGQAAVSQAPADPFLNWLLSSALAERAAHGQVSPSASQDGWF